MAVQPRIPGLESTIFTDFSGGWNTRSGPFELSDNESPDLMNVNLLIRGAVGQRDGKTRFDSANFPAAKFAEHCRSWYFGSTKLLMASIDGTLYSSDTSGVLTSRIVGTAGSIWHMESMTDSTGADFLWCCNGVDTPRKISTSLVVSNWVDGTGTNDVISAVKMCRVWRNRMIIVTTGLRLAFSAIGNPENFTDLDFLDVKASDDDLDKVTWLENLGDNLLIFKKNSVWSLYAEPPTPAVKRLGRPGCEDRFQTAVCDQACYYWNRTGLWSTDGSVEPQMETGNIEDWIANNQNFGQLARVRVFPSKDRRIFVALPTSASLTNNRLIEVIPYLAAEDADPPIAIHDLPVSSMCSFRVSEIDEILAGSSDGTNGKLHRLFVGSDDDGVAIHSWWQSSWKPLTAEEKIERLRRVNVLMSGKVTASVREDFAESNKFSQGLEIATGVDPFWDGGTWDGGIWDVATRAGLQRMRPEARGRYHAFRFENSELGKTWTVYSVELMSRGGKEH